MNGDVHVSAPAAPGRSSSPGPDRKDERFQIDFLTWRARLSAPGSRFASAPPVPLRTTRRASGRLAADRDQPERRTA